MSLVMSFLILISSFPIGYLIRYLTRDELKSGKKYFHFIWIVSLLFSVIILFVNIVDLNYKKAIIFTLLFIANVAFISWKK